MAFRIFPEDQRVLQLLTQMARCVSQAVDHLAEYVVASEERTAELMPELLSIEDQATNLYFSLMTTTRSSYVVPIPRPNLYHLGRGLLRAVQHLVACAETQQLYALDRPSRTATEQLATIQRMSEMTAKAMGRLMNLDTLDEYWFEMVRLARQSERLQRSYRAEILEHHKPGQALRRLEIADQLFRASTALDRVASEVGRILVAES